jgi:hypothetical protein
VWASAALAAFVAALGVIGADALWLVPLGDRIVHGELPGSIPYATAPTSGWHDVPAGGQLVFWAFYHAFGGDRGLVLAQALGAAVGLGSLAHGLGRQDSAGGALLGVALVALGSLPALAVTSVSLYSLALFPVLLALVQAERDGPTRRIWAAVPLLALWGNLHGAVLAGWGLLACYVVFDRGRRRPRESALLLGSATLALFANPELWHTPRYYWSVFHNETARQGTGLWAALGTRPFDVLLVAVFVLFVGLSLRRGRAFRLWEAVAVAGSAAATGHVARNGVWLLCLAAYPAARSVVRAGPRPRLLGAVPAAAAVAVAAGIVRGPGDPGSRSLARTAARPGATVLAEPVLGQQVAVAGGRVWVDNPLDAFRKRDQRLYVDWSSGDARGARALEHASLVLVRRSSAAGRRAANDPRLVLVSEDDGGALYRRRRAGGS